MKMEPLLTKDELEHLYWEERLTQKQIGDRLGVWDAHISDWMRQYHLAVRPISERHAHRINLAMNETLAYFLGIMYGDGGIFDNAKWRTHQVILNTTSKELALSFYKTLCVMGLHPYRFRINRKKENLNWNPIFRIGASSRQVVEWYKNLTLLDLYTLLKTTKQVSAFLRGIYESEGTWYRQSCFISNRNRELVALISWLLIKIGIPHKIYHNKRKNATDIQIYINKTNSVKFLELVKPCIKKP